MECDHCCDQAEYMIMYTEEGDSLYYSDDVESRELNVVCKCCYEDAEKDVHCITLVTY